MLPLFPCLALAGCSGESDTPVSFTVRAKLSDGVTAALCSATAGVTRLEYKVLSPDGLSTQAGWPKTQDCASADMFTDSSMAPGSYVLEVTAVGTLAGDPNAVLYRARRPLELPADAMVDLSLEPQVAFLKLSWKFADKDLATVCAQEIERLSLFISTGAAGTGSFMNLDLGCQSTPYEVPALFLPQGYTIQMNAEAKGTGLKLYSATETRLLERGRNPEFTVVLRPLGSRIRFDFRFAIEAAMADACDDARVAATSVTATVRNMDGDDPVVATIPCSAQRPIEFPGASFTKGRALELDVESEGVHRFLAKRPFLLTMDGDADLGLLTLRAVGSATISASVTSTACGTIDRIAADVQDSTSHMSIFQGDLGATGGNLIVPDVPYGDYDVSVQGFAGAVAKCRAASRGRISGRENVWAPLSL